MTYSKNFCNEQHEKTVMANGLTILSLKNDTVASVSIEVWVKVGSRSEDKKLNGITHFIEHMNFKGTSKRTAKQIAEEFDAIGGYLNAYTSKEHTVYSAKVLKEFLPLAIDMLSDIMFNSVYLDEDIEKEKNVVLQELAQTEDNPEEMVFEYFADSAFQNQAIGRTILGVKENILKFTQQDIIDFTRLHYVAPKMIVSAAGDVDHNELVQLLEENFYPFTAQEDAVLEKGIYTGGHKFVENLELSQSHLVIGYEGVNIKSEDYYKMEMLANILGGSISSRLFQEIREKRGLVYSIGAFCNYFSDTGVFGMFLSTSKETLEESLKLVSDEIRKITNTITQEEVNRCLAQVKASLYMSREVVDNWVSILANNYSCQGRYISRDEIWNGYSSITIEQLHRFAKTIFSNQKSCTVAALGDIKSLPDSKAIQELLTI